jgi:hypothetical protein
MCEIFLFTSTLSELFLSKVAPKSTSYFSEPDFVKMQKRKIGVSNLSGRRTGRVGRPVPAAYLSGIEVYSGPLEGFSFT